MCADKTEIHKTDTLSYESLLKNVNKKQNLNKKTFM